jgi:hypothetical protein
MDRSIISENALVALFALTGTSNDVAAYTASEPVPRKHLDDEWGDGSISKAGPRVSACELGHNGEKDPDGSARKPREGVFTWIVTKQNGVGRSVRRRIQTSVKCRRQRLRSERSGAEAPVHLCCERLVVAGAGDNLCRIRTGQYAALSSGE